MPGRLRILITFIKRPHDASKKKSFNIKAFLTVRCYFNSKTSHIQAAIMDNSKKKLEISYSRAPKSIAMWFCCFSYILFLRIFGIFICFEKVDEVDHRMSYYTKNKYVDVVSDQCLYIFLRFRYPKKNNSGKKTLCQYEIENCNSTIEETAEFTSNKRNQGITKAPMKKDRYAHLSHFCRSRKLFITLHKKRLHFCKPLHTGWPLREDLYKYPVNFRKKQDGRLSM